MRHGAPTRRPHRPVTPLSRRLCLVAVAAIVLTACTGGHHHPGGSGAPTPTESGAPTGSPWEQVNAEVGPDGQVSTDTALRAFAVAFGPLPDVTTPPGPVDDISSGTGALRWLVGHWDDISPAQQRAATALVPGLQPLARAKPGASPGGPDGEAGVLSRPRAYYTALAVRLAQEIEAHVGVKLELTLDAAEHPVVASVKAEAETLVYNAAGGYHGAAARCVISVNPAMVLVGAHLEMVMAHEVWHCYEAQIVGLDQFYSKIHPRSWVCEGEAEWVGFALRPNAGDDGWWNTYIDNPRRRLFARTYDAIGFYSHLADTGADPWQALVPVLRAGSNAEAFAAAGATSDKFLDSWASSYFQVPDLGPTWAMRGPGLPARSGPIPERITVANTRSTAFTAPAYANGVFSLVSQADVTLFAIRGHARLGDHINRRDYVLDSNTDVRFCTRPGGCACPPGSGYSGPPLTNLDTATLLAVASGSAGSYGAVTGQTLERFCKAKTAATSSPSPASTAPVTGHVPDRCPSDALVGMGYHRYTGVGAAPDLVPGMTTCAYLVSSDRPLLYIQLAPGHSYRADQIPKDAKALTVAGADAAWMVSGPTGEVLYVNAGNDLMNIQADPGAAVALAERILREG